MKRLLLVVAIFSLVIGGMSSVRAAQKVWSGLVIANNVGQPAAVPEELGKIEKPLKELFGYNQFNIIGQASKLLRTGDEDWLASSKYFSLHVDSKSETADGYLVNLQLYKEKELLLETDTKLGKSSPLIIKGPQVGDGQLLLVLVVDEERTPSAQSQHARHRRSDNEIVTAWHRFTRAIRNSLR